MLATRNWAALILGVCMATSVMAETEAPRPPVGDRVVAYSGTQGVKVWTARYGERADNQALVEIDGIDHDWNKRIHKMKVEKTNKDVRYSTEVNGSQYVALIIQGNYGELFVPGESQTVKLSYDDALSSQGNPQHFLTDFLQQPAK